MIKSNWVAYGNDLITHELDHREDLNNFNDKIWIFIFILAILTLSIIVVIAYLRKHAYIKLSDKEKLIYFGKRYKDIELIYWKDSSWNIVKDLSNSSEKFLIDNFDTSFVVHNKDNFVRPENIEIIYERETDNERNK